MLLEFKASNYKSFKDTVIFTLIPAPKQKGLDYSVFHQTIGNQTYRSICSSVIYGPNASGKTNIIGAMDTMRSIVLRGNICNAYDYSPNVASNHLELIPNNTLNEKQPVSFSISFIEESYKIDYSLVLDLGVFLEKDYTRKILNETLCVNGITVFERSDTLQLYYSKKLSEIIPNQKTMNSIINIAGESLNPNELFLMNGFKLIVSRKLSDIIMHWFQDKFMVIYKANDIELIRRFDNPQTPGIFIEKTTSEAAKLFGLNANDIGYVVSNEENNTELCSILDDYHSKDKIMLKADIFESFGTIRFVHIFPLIMKAISTGGTLVIDEFDASIHPMALMNIINIFHDDDINIHHAQLIFDTHNPIFLNSNLLRRDEIKFVERDDQTHTSELYSLSDFKTSGKNGVRKNEDYLKNYFVSQYGAIVDIDFSPIFRK